MGRPAGDVAEAQPQHYAVTPGQGSHDGHNSKEDGQQNGHQHVHGEAEEFLHFGLCPPVAGSTGSGSAQAVVDYLTVAHSHDAVGHFAHFQGVGDEDEGLAVFPV